MKIFLSALLMLFAANSITAQVIYNHKVDSVSNLVSSTSLANFNKDLSGEQNVTVGGNLLRIYSRVYDSPMNPVAAQYIFEKFQSFGINARFQYNSTTNIIVIGKITGMK